jgi:hypothetical protein
MSLNHSPSIVTNGLVLSLDAANQKSYGPFTVEALVVAGGGSGGGNLSGGGGAGGLLYSSALQVTAGTAYTVTVGSGGAAVSGQQAGIVGNNGGNSIFSTLTAIGGGGGGGGYFGTGSASGGSGGGGSGYTNSTPYTGAAGTSGQGYAGGDGANGAGNYNGGGGGGAGGVGTTVPTSSNVIGGNGGPGLQYAISGSPTWYAGGGGGGNYVTGIAGNGGLGGGGGGGSNVSASTVGLGGIGYNTGQNGIYSIVYSGGTAGTGGQNGGNAGTNTGGGGGGTGHQTFISGAGGSGIVIIRYAGPQKATGGTITTNNSYTIHTFTTSGTFTPGANWADTSGNNNIGTLTNGPVYSNTYNILNPTSQNIFTFTVNNQGGAGYAGDPKFVADRANRTVTTDWPLYGVQILSVAHVSWLKVDCKQPYTVTSFAVSGYPGGSHKPGGAWSLQGSNDDVNWSVVATTTSDKWKPYSYAGADYSGTYPFDAAQIISVTSPGNYRYYRIYADTFGSNGTNDYMLVMNVGLWVNTGGSIEFDGVNDYVAIPNTLLGNGDIAWSVGAWVKTTSATDGLGINPILTNASSGPVYSSMGVNLGKISYWTYHAGWYQSLGTTTVNTGNWVYLTWVNNSNYTMNMYVNGVLDATVANSTSGNSNPVDRVGGSWAGYFPGSIAGLTIYKNKALAAAEVAQNFNAMRGRYGI